MDSLINKSRPPAFCPGCTHEKITAALDRALQELGIPGNRVVIVSDIGCSGLFDTFFNTHAFHGLHGRALTYATGLKMARPDLNVVVTMGDGGLGIGGAHLLASCRRNLDITLLVLNNFNFGMTGGQYSATTPADAETGSAFLNRLEKPVDICKTASAAGAGFVSRLSGMDDNLAAEMARAITFAGFSLIETYGICTGRFTKRNRLSPKLIGNMILERDQHRGIVKENQRPEFGESYRKTASQLEVPPEPVKVIPEFIAPGGLRSEVVLLGSAGMRVITAGELLCYAGLSAGLRVSQKNDYNITVLRGLSVGEVILAKEEILFTGILKPGVILALGDEGIMARKDLFQEMDEDGVVFQAEGVSIPRCRGKIVSMPFKSLGVRKPDWALGALAFMAKMDLCISREMLAAAIALKFKGSTLDAAMEVIEKI